MVGDGQPFEGEKDPETRAGAVVREDVDGVVTEDGIVLGVMEGGEMKPGPSTFRPSIPRDELASYVEDHDQDHTLITTLDGRLVGVVRRQDL